MYKYYSIIAGICCFYLFSGHVVASDITLEKSTRNIAIERDGTYVVASTMLAKLNTEAGAKALGQIPVPFSESLQELEILEAYTLKPDGTRIDVKKEAIFTQASPVAVSAPMFNDIKMRIVVFPEPVAGGKIFLAVRIKQKIAFFPGHVSFLEMIPTTVAQELTEISVSAPADYPLRTDVRGYVGGEVEIKNGRRFWKWTIKNPTARKPEPYELMEFDFGSYVAVSSFKDWTELGNAYLARADAKAQPTDAIKAQAAEIVKGAKDKRDEVRKIYEWTIRNVRYVGVFLGLGGFVPRDVTQILETKYGDCKDYTTLMIALLRARGIDATTALINTGYTYTLPKVPVVGAFNHAITYVPEFDLYLDGTSQFSAWDALPIDDSDKNVLLTGLGKLAVTPKLPAASEMVKNVVAFMVRPNGTIVGRTTVSTHGFFESNLRASLANIPAGQDEKWVSGWIKRAGPNATATVIKSDPRDPALRQQFEVAFEVKEAMALESPGAFRLPVGLVQNSIGTSFNNINQVGPRKTPFYCSSFTKMEEFEISLPANIDVTALPKSVSFQGEITSFISSYQLQGNKILVARKLVWNRPRSVCSPEMWPEIEQLAAAVARDARGQVLLK